MKLSQKNVVCSFTLRLPSLSQRKTQQTSNPLHITSIDCWRSFLNCIRQNLTCYKQTNQRVQSTVGITLGAVLSCVQTNSTTSTDKENGHNVKMKKAEPRFCLTRGRITVKESKMVLRRAYSSMPACHSFQRMVALAPSERNGSGGSFFGVSLCKNSSNIGVVFSTASSAAIIPDSVPLTVPKPF